ncbi:ribonuclease H-like domain-containing protein [Tanacetum coccineum]
MYLNFSMIHCSQEKVLDLEKTKTTQANEIANLKRRVKKLEKKRSLRTHKLKRLYKVSLSARVESSRDEESLGEDASKQERINAIDADEDINLVNVQDDADKEMYDVGTVTGDEVFAKQEVVAKDVNLTVDEVTLAQDLNVPVNAASALIKAEVQDKGKGKMIEPEPVKKMMLVIEVGERLVLFQKVVDDDFGEAGIWHVLMDQVSYLAKDKDLDMECTKVESPRQFTALEAYVARLRRNIPQGLRRKHFKAYKQSPPPAHSASLTSNTIHTVLRGEPNPQVIMEYLVNISKRRAFWSLNEDILKINDSDYQYAVSIKEDTAYPCLHSPKTTKETSSIRRIQRRPIRHIKDICMTRSSSNELFTPYKEPEQEFRSSRRHFKTLSLDELRSPDFNLLSDQEYSEEEVAETMAETMEQYMSKTRTDYRSGVGCEQCKGPHYTKDCPLKEEGKILEEAYYMQFDGPFQGGGYRATTPGFYQRNNANPSYQE